MREMKRAARWMGLVFCLLVLAAAARTVHAAQDRIPGSSDNLVSYLEKYSALTPVSGGYMRTYCLGETFYIEYYDDSFSILGKKEIALELPYWGGFFAGEDAYWLIEGQPNESEDDSAEVIRVIRYDLDWNRTGAAAITSDPDLFGGEVSYPFDHGCVECTEYEGMLYIVTAHQGYVDASVGQGHQGFLMIAVDESAMTGGIVACDLWHSFSQYIGRIGEDLYVQEQSDGSRCTKLTRYDRTTFAGTMIPVVEYGGTHTSAWAIPCYASADRLAVSDSTVLSVGTSIDQSRYEEARGGTDLPHNIYLTVTPADDFSTEATRVRWLTSYTEGDNSFTALRIIKVNDNRFMICWEETGDVREMTGTDLLSTGNLHYIFVDKNGKSLCKEKTAAATLSDCRAAVRDGKISFCSSNANMVDFYTIDASTYQLTKKEYRVAGPSAVWAMEDGVMTVSGTGEVAFDADAHFRYPLSSTESVYSYSSSDNAMKPIRGSVAKLVFESGLTSIGDGLFQRYENLQEVEIHRGMTRIGKEAFAYSRTLSKVSIPASVKTIGEDIVWTGYFWIGDENAHVYKATLCGEDHSAAQKYAEENGIGFEAASVTLQPKTAVYTGKAVRADAPEVTGTTGAVTVRYYTDKACTVPTTKENSGASAEGAAPVLIGTYYAKAAAAPDNVYREIRSKAVKLVIEAPPLPFKDVQKEDAFYKAVEWAYYSKIVMGKSKTVFAPADGIKRGEFCTMLWRMFGKPAVSAADVEKLPFADAKASNHKKAIAWCYKQKIISGYKDGTFKPSRTITRGNILVMLFKIAKKEAAYVPASIKNPFTDVKEGSSAMGAYKWAYANGIVTGRKLQPGTACTRAQMVEFLYRYHKAYRE